MEQSDKDRWESELWKRRGEGAGCEERVRLVI